MAEGAAKCAGAEIGISTTGIAGPDGGTEDMPVGTAFIGIHINGKTFAQKVSSSGTRERIRNRTVYSALNLLRKEMLDLK